MMLQDKTIAQDVRYAVVVMGMHRSGTSALAGLLVRLGCDAPKDLMEAKPMNPKGFYESSTIRYMNDALLKSAGSSWFTWQEFNKGWFRSPEAAEFRDLALANLKEVFDTSRLALLKDPRMCLLVPFWEDVFTIAGYVPKYLHTHRDPLEVAQSLSHWAGYDPAYGQILWLRYVLEAEVATRGKARSFTSYHQIMQDWPMVAQRSSDALDLVWPGFSNRVCAEIDGFLSGDLQHMKAQSKRPNHGGRFSPWVSETFEIMERWAEEGEQPNDHAALDAIRENFNRATPVFSALVEGGRRDALSLRVKAREERQTRARLATLQAEVMLAREHLKAAQDERDLSFASLAELEDKTGKLTRRKATLESELAQRSLEAEEVGNQFADACRDIERLTRELQEARAGLDTLAAGHEQAMRRESEKKAAERDALLRDLRNQKLRFEQEMRDQLVSALRSNRAHIDAERAKAEAERMGEREQLLQRQREAEEKARVLLESTSWRLTAPLRRLVMAYRRVRERP